MHSKIPMNIIIIPMYVCMYVCVCVCMYVYICMVASFKVHVCMYVCMCVYVCMLVAMWCSGCVLGSGPEVLEFKPPLWQFSSFSICLPPFPPVHPAVIGYLAFAGVQIQGLFSCNSNGPGETSGAHTTCCEERPVLLRVPSPAPSACIVYRHPGSARCA